MHNTTFDNIADNLRLVLDIMENCGEAYRNAGDSTKKLMNQAIFNKIYIVNDAEHEFDVDNPSNMTTHSNNGYFFRHNSSSKELLVDLRGVPPAPRAPFWPRRRVKVHRTFPLPNASHSPSLFDSPLV